MQSQVCTFEPDNPQKNEIRDGNLQDIVHIDFQDLASNLYHCLSKPAKPVSVFLVLSKALGTDASGTGLRLTRGFVRELRVVWGLGTCHSPDRIYGKVCLQASRT